MSASENALGIKSAATVEELVAATKDTGVRRIAVRGDLTNGAGVAPIEQLGAIETLGVSGGFVAAGGGFDKI